MSCYLGTVTVGNVRFVAFDASTTVRVEMYASHGAHTTLISKGVYMRRQEWESMVEAQQAQRTAA